jgi:hypothetical protein
MPAWDFQQDWGEENELADDQLAVDESWIGVYHEAGVLQATTVKAARDAFLTAQGWSIGKQNVDYPGAYLKRVRTQRIDKTEAFNLLVHWENKTGGEDPPDDFDQFMQQSQQNNFENPHGPDYSSHGQFAEEYSHKDLDGDLFVNRANQMLRNIPPLMITIKVRKVSINRPDEADIGQMGVAEGFRLLYGVNNEMRTHKNKQTGKTRKYFRTTYEVWEHPFRQWAIVELLNVGFAILVNGKLEIPRLGKGKDKPQFEVNLSADGTKVLSAGEQPNTIPFKVFREGTINVPFL